MTTFNDYVTEVAKADAPGQRAGQLHFNVLFLLRPRLADAIRSTPLDPFYQDARLPEFLNAVEERWTDR